MLASDITTRAARILFDVTKVRWTSAELLDYVSDGQRAVVLVRPDSNAQNAVVQLVGGTRQALPTGGITLLRVNRNMGTTGAVPGAAVRETSRVSLDNEIPDWHYARPSTTLEHYVFDPIDPTRWYAYPCVTGALGSPANCYAEIVYSATPAPVTAEGQVLALGDQYINPLLDWTLYRAYSKDASYAGNMNRAQTHLQAFGQALGIGIKVQMAASIPPERAAEALRAQMDA